MIEFTESGAYRHNYKMRVESKHHFMTPALREEIGELYEALVHAYFLDSGSLAVWIETDVERWFAGVYLVDVTHETGLIFSQRQKFRHTIDIVAREGLIGTFFKIIVEKVIPDTGVFDFFGTDLQVIPRREYGPEFLTPFTANTELYT